MSQILPFCLRRTALQHYRLHYITKRTILSEAYHCEEAWQRRLDSPLLKQLKMEQYFVETDKKFATKKLVSGIDVDLFANNVQEETELDEIEHLLYRFRKTKRSVEIMDSTTYAVVRAFLKFRQYGSLFRILNDRESYGIFPDFYAYNLMMDTFIKEKMYKEAAQTAVIMMLQEDFRNKLSVLLALHSCQMFLNECSIDSLNPETVADDESKEGDDDEDDVMLVRVPFLRNPWFDDHFQITNPKHLIGKTLYLLGREINNALGRSYQIIGLSMYDKWDKVAELLTTFSESSDCKLVKESIEKVQSLINEIPEDEEKTKEKWLNKFSALFQKMQTENKIEEGSLLTSLEAKLKDVLPLQEKDIEEQKKLFAEWEVQRQVALNKQNIELEKERRLKVIEEKKEYLYWKEKYLFFYENENKNLEEMKKVEEYLQLLESSKTVEDTYVVPEMIKRPTERRSIYKKLANVKKIM